jgi:hypothetical protein
MRTRSLPGASRLWRADAQDASKEASCGISIFRLAEGRIADHWEQLDRLALMQRLGVVPAPGVRLSRHCCCWHRRSGAPSPAAIQSRRAALPPRSSPPLPPVAVARRGGSSRGRRQMPRGLNLVRDVLVGVLFTLWIARRIWLLVVFGPANHRQLPLISRHDRRHATFPVGECAVLGFCGFMGPSQMSVVVG